MENTVALKIFAVLKYFFYQLRMFEELSFALKVLKPEGSSLPEVPSPQGEFDELSPPKQSFKPAKLKNETL